MLYLQIHPEPKAEGRHLHGERRQQEAEKCRQELRQVIPIIGQLLLRRRQGDPLHLPQDGLDRQQRQHLPEEQRR